MNKKIRTIFSITLFIFLMYDSFYSPVFTDKPIMSYINPKIDKMKFVPNDIQYYNLQTPARAIILFEGSYSTNDFRDYNTQIKFLNIYDKNIKIDKIILKECYENYYESKTVPIANGRVEHININENKTIKLNQEFKNSNFFPVNKDNYGKVEIQIDYESFLNLTANYYPLSLRTYYCNFELYEDNNILYNTNSSYLSSDLDYNHGYFMNAIMNLD